MYFSMNAEMLTCMVSMHVSYMNAEIWMCMCVCILLHGYKLYWENALKLKLLQGPSFIMFIAWEDAVHFITQYLFKRDTQKEIQYSVTNHSLPQDMYSFFKVKTSCISYECQGSCIFICGDSSVTWICLMFYLNCFSEV